MDLIHTLLDYTQMASTYSQTARAVVAVTAGCFIADWCHFAVNAARVPGSALVFFLIYNSLL